MVKEVWVWSRRNQKLKKGKETWNTVTDTCIFGGQECTQYLLSSVDSIQYCTCMLHFNAFFLATKMNEMYIVLVGWLGNIFRKFNGLQIKYFSN